MGQGNSNATQATWGVLARQRMVWSYRTTVDKALRFLTPNNQNAADLSKQPEDTA